MAEVLVQLRAQDGQIISQSRLIQGGAEIARIDFGDIGGVLVNRIDLALVGALPEDRAAEITELERQLDAVREIVCDHGEDWRDG